MGKKKQFINKKSAASFHIVHRSTPHDPAADAASSSLSSLSLSSSATTSAPSSAYYFQPSKSDTAIPAGFPVDLLVAQNEEQELELYRRDRKTARERERDSRDPSLLPHEYDYSAHLREIGGGVFIAAVGAAAYESASSKREKQQREQRQQAGQHQLDARSQQPAVEDELDKEVDWDMVRRAEKAGKKRKRQGGAPAKVPADVMLALEEDEQVTADGELDELDDDFVMQAMKGTGDTEDEGDEDEDDEKDEDEDDEEEMMRKIQQYEMHELGVEEGDEGEDEEEGEEWAEQDDDEEIKSGDDEKAGLPQRQVKTGKSTKPSVSAGAARVKEAKEAADTQTGEADGEQEDGDSFWDDEDELDDEDEAEDEEEDEVRPLPSRALDADFDRLLSEQYGDDDIGGLDDADESLLNGQLPIESFSESLDAFLSRQSLPVSQGGSDLSLPSAERDTIRRRMVRRLRAMAAEEGAEGDVEGRMSDVYKQVVDDGWDVESIVSTYSNTENHPTAIREKRSKAAIQQAAKRTEQAQAALAAAITEALQPTQQQHEEDGSEEDGEEEDDDGATRNLGVARPRGESAEEKRARKAAMKAEKRESRQRKKQMRTLYAAIEHKQQLQQTKASVDNPAGRQLI